MGELVNGLTLQSLHPMVHKSIPRGHLLASHSCRSIGDGRARLSGLLGKLEGHRRYCSRPVPAAATPGTATFRADTWQLMLSILGGRGLAGGDIKSTQWQPAPGCR